MKNSTLKRLFLLVIISLCNLSFAQTTDPTVYFARFITGQNFLTGNGIAKDTVQALKLFIDCAENGGMSMAMNQLGIMYQFGNGIKKDTDKAFYWYSKSVAKGDPVGTYALGNLYKKGEGVGQDFTKAFSYFKASAEKGYEGGIYATGYCYFKGLGTTQSYNEAVKWFQKGVEKNVPVCAFMLGKCHRNGYGVEQNEKEALRLLKYASDKNISEAEKELKTGKPEVVRGKLGKILVETDGESKNSLVQIEAFKKLIKHDVDLDLTGIWSGKLFVYDWSREYIINESTIIIDMKHEGKRLTGKLSDDEGLVAKLDGVNLEGHLVFQGSDFTGTNQHGDKYPMQFTSARFESINADVNYLVGNIESYSPFTKEPGYPCFIVISRAIEFPSKTDAISKTDVLKAGEMISGKQTEMQTNVDGHTESEIIQKEHNPSGKLAKQALYYFRNKTTFINVYPNPFKNEFNINYKVMESSPVEYSIYSEYGTLILTRKIGVRKEGTYTEKVQTNLIPGQYIVKLNIGNESFSQLIIKQ